MKALLASLSLVVLCACGSAPTCPEPFYDGKGSDESWRSMQDGEARATKDDTKAVTLFAPTANQSFPSATPFKLTWSTPLTASLDRPARARPSTLSQLGNFIYSSAWAHLPPVTGPLHLLRISDGTNACPIEVVTTRLEWTPNDAAWAKLKEKAGKKLTLDVYSAYLLENRISEGPFHLTKPVGFTVTP